jgi:hypothetical protein
MPSLELLDVVQHSKPHISAIDVQKTANSLRAAGGSRKNYNMAIDPISVYCSGKQKQEDLLKYLRTHPDPAWHKYLEDVGTRLLDIFGSNVSSWYPVGRKPIESLAGLLIKPAIRGVWVNERQPFPCLINARGSVLLEPKVSLPFVARGVYEAHVRDEIGVFGPMIVDLGKDPRTNLRANRVYYPQESEMMSIELFEEILRKFNEALILAGFRPRVAASAFDLFRTR